MLSLLLFVGTLFVSDVIYKYIIYPVFLSPLAKIPSAHPSSSISPLWILYKRYHELENNAIHTAHAKHGDIVRLGPNEVSVICVDDGIRTVYSGGFEKWAWYENQFNNYGYVRGVGSQDAVPILHMLLGLSLLLISIRVPNMFAMTTSKAHSIRKRIISNVYSKTFLQSSPELHTIAQEMLYARLFPLLADAAARQEPVEVLELNFSSTMDFIIAFMFGLQNASNFLQDLGARKHWLGVYQSRRPYRFWNAEAPGFVSCARKFGVNIVPKWVDAANQEIEDWTLDKCKAAQASLLESDLSKDTSQSETNPKKTSPVVYAQLAASIQPLPSSPSYKTPLPPPSLAIATEVLDHLAAGHETSGITLTYLMHELSLHHDIQTRLRAELLTLSPPFPYPPSRQSKTTNDHPPLPSSRDIDGLPLLHATLMETLRLHAAIPGPQPRITPPTGTTLANHSIPGNVRVSSLAYTLHRNASVFPCPETWNPNRWLDATEAQKQEMARWFWAFGSGGRMCVGSHFAVQEMKLIIAAIYTNFTTYVVDDEGIEQIDAYTAPPRANRLMLRFEKVQP